VELFAPARGLRNKHLQTIAGSFSLRRPPRESERLSVRADQDTELEVEIDRAPPGPSDRTFMLVVHGMCGSSRSPFAVDITHAALAHGLSTARMNMRNCGGTERKTPTLYHSNMHGDLAAVVSAIIERCGAERVVIAGYSIGGNLTLNYLAAHAGNIPREVI